MGKTFAVKKQSTKSVKSFHRETKAIYGIPSHLRSKQNSAINVMEHCKLPRNARSDVHRLGSCARLDSFDCGNEF